MEKNVIEQLFSNRTLAKRGKTVSLYFNRQDLIIYERIESYARQNNIAVGRVIIEMLKSFGLMCAFSNYWDMKIVNEGLNKGYEKWLRTRKKGRK